MAADGGRCRSGEFFVAGHGRKSESERDRVAMLLASGATAARAAARCGVSLRTVQRWLAKDADFAARVRELRCEMGRRTVGYLARVSLEAARTLRKQLQSPKGAVATRAA